MTQRVFFEHDDRGDQRTAARDSSFFPVQECPKMSPNLTPDERRALGIATLTAACVAAATGLVTWAMDEAKRLLEKHREPPDRSSRPAEEKN